MSIKIKKRSFIKVAFFLLKSNSEQHMYTIKILNLHHDKLDYY